jgi:FAD:protein FMN transferase
VQVTSRRQALGALGGAILLPWSDRAGAGEATTLHERRALFGGPADVIVRPSATTPAQCAAVAVQEVFAGLAQMNERWNAWKPGELSALNRCLRSGVAATTTPALVALIRAAQRLEALSAGWFNPAIGAAVRGWGFHADLMQPGDRPSPASLRAWRHARPSLAQLEIRGLQVRSANRALQLDFGAYAKGVAADWALDRLRARGITQAVVNLGGNLAATSDAGAAWRIGIRDPAGDGLIASLPVGRREAVVTSGSYERWRLVDGERCTHLLDPFSATPVHDLVSVTVLHADAGHADAAATALLVAGRQRWRPLAERLGVTQVLVVGRDGRGEVSATLAPRLAFASPGWRAAIHVV